MSGPKVTVEPTPTHTVWSLAEWRPPKEIGSLTLGPDGIMRGRLTALPTSILEVRSVGPEIPPGHLDLVPAALDPGPEIQALRVLVAEALAASFEGGELDGGYVQDRALALGILAGHTVTGEEASVGYYEGAEPGERVYAARWTVEDDPGWTPILATRES